MNGDPILETERLICRPARIEDAEALHAFYSDEEAMRYFSHPPFDSIEQTRAKFQSVIDSPSWLLWVITRKGDDRAIGTLGAEEKRQGRVMEIAYTLVPEQWGGGLASEALSALCDHLFAAGNRKLMADTDPDNAPSRRLLEKLGFSLEGMLRDHWETHIGIRDTALYGLLKEEWTCRDRT